MDKERRDSEPIDAHDVAASTGGGPRFHLVGIGASAGGLEPIETFFTTVPARAGLAYIVLQHLSPDHERRMPELLAQWTEIPVKTVSHGLEIEPDHIYLALPGTQLTVSGGRVLLSERRERESGSLPIDHLFRSLARDAGRYAVGIVLSGTGSDGSRGACAIREAGGLVICQSPGTATFAGMPRSAEQTEAVDLSLSPDLIPRALVEYVQQAVSVEQWVDNEYTPVPTGPLARIIGMLRAAHDVDFTHYKASTVQRRVQRRVTLMSSPDLVDYARLVAEDEQELEQLYRDLLIGVTEYFRDIEAFEALGTHVLEELIVGATDELRVWVAGCATGEEAYSLAILFHEKAAQLGVPLRLRLFATDVHAGSLDVASAGRYPRSALHGLSSARRARYFVEDGDGYFRVCKELRRMIVFARHNVISDAPFTRLDLVSCRNLLIYLQPEAQNKVLSLQHFALKPRGVLFMGPSETPGALREEFEAIEGCTNVFRKRGDLRLSAGPLDARLESTRLPHERTHARWTGAPSTDIRLVRLYDRLLAEYMPAGLLVDEDYRLLHSFAGAERFLRLPGGRASVNVLDLVHAELRSSLSGALQQAERRGETVRCAGVSVQDSEGEIARVHVVVRPYTDCWSEGAFLILLEPVCGPAPGPGIRELDMTVTSSDYVRSLEEELQFARENLHATVEELRSSNEELQASNEKQVASNEEMQSTNEELHSVNEELYRVNAEYQKQIIELSEVTSDMDNLLHSLDVGVLFLDGELRVRKFTEPMAEVLHLMPADIGRKLDHFVHNLDDDEISVDVQRILDGQPPVEREVATRDGNFLYLRILPYRNQDEINGVVLTLIGIDALKRHEAEIQRLSSLIVSSGDAVIGATFDGTIVDWNRGAEEMFHHDAAIARGANLSLIVPQDRWHEIDKAIVAARRGERLSPIETERVRKDGHPIEVSEAIAPVRDERGRVMGFGCIIRDITRLRRAERQVRKAVRQRDQFIAILSHELRNPLMGIQSALDVLQTTDAPEAQGRARNVLQRQVKQMSMILEDLLDVSRLRRDEIDMTRETYDLRSVIEPVLSSVQSRLDGSHIDLLVERPDEPVWVHGDPARLQQMTVNLLANAIKFTPEGRRIRLVVERDGDVALLVVSDEGVGIPPELIESIFDPFTQGDEDGERHTSSMGLGLAVARAIARAHGGDITASSPGRGRGSTFIVELPRTAPQVDTGSVTREPQPAAARGTRPLRLLLVEDQEDNRELLAMLLRREGYEVVASDSGQDALRVIEEGDIDVALLDLGLPDMSGIEVARRARQLRDRDALRLVALTGHGTRNDRERTAEAGFDEHLAKPVNFATLRKVLHAV